MLKRFALSEITFERVSGHLLRRLAYLDSWKNWHTSEVGRFNQLALEAYRNKHSGERAIIICNGPSLKKTDMKLVQNETSFCMNRSYLMFEDWGFTPTYFSLTNELVLQQFAQDIRALPMPKFTDFAYRDLLKPQHGTTYFRLPPRLADKFEGDLRNPISSGGTVTFATLQIAYCLGFRDVIIIGMDHRFKAQGVPSAAEIRKNAVDEDHAHPNYFPKGMKWELPDLIRSELAYRQAREKYEMAGRRIIDATVDGACTVFEKMTLEDALRVTAKS